MTTAPEEEELQRRPPVPPSPRFVAAEVTTASLRLAGVVLVASALLASCGPKPPIGDEQGGVIDWFSSTKGQVEDATSAHCARYGKTAKITRTDSDKSGGHAVFVCE